MGNSARAKPAVSQVCVEEKKLDFNGIEHLFCHASHLTKRFAYNLTANNGAIEASAGSLALARCSRAMRNSLCMSVSSLISMIRDTAGKEDSRIRFQLSNRQILYPHNAVVNEVVQLSEIRCEPSADEMLPPPSGRLEAASGFAGDRSQDTAP